MHVCRVIKTLINGNNTTVTDWPTRSPDLNSTENLWDILARAIYMTGKHYDSVSSLKLSIT